MFAYVYLKITTETTSDGCITNHSIKSNEKNIRIFTNRKDARKAMDTDVSKLKEKHILFKVNENEKYAFVDGFKIKNIFKAYGESKNSGMFDTGMGWIEQSEETSHHMMVGEIVPE